MNLILILSFEEIFATYEFNEEFNISNFDCTQALAWIREPLLPEAQLIVTRVADKANGPHRPWKDQLSTHKSTRSYAS